MHLTPTPFDDTRVLIVNDNNLELKAFVAALQQEGFHATGAKNHVETLTAIKSSNYHVALIDLMMPDMNGLKLARILRKQFPSIKTMLMSDYLLSPVQLAKADTGIVGFVPKPCRFEELAQFIREKVGPKSSREELLNNTNTNTSNVSDAPFDVLSVQFSY